jgi:integrase
MKVMGLSKRKTGIYEFRMNFPADLRHKLNNKTQEYTDLGYDQDSAIRQAIKLRTKYKTLFRSLRQQIDSSTSGSSILESHGIPSRKLIGDEALFLPNSFEELTQEYRTVEEMPETLQQASNILKGIQTVKLLDALQRYERETGKKNLGYPVKQFVELVGNLDITLLRREQAYRFREELVSRNNAPATQRKRLGALARLLSWSSKEFDLPQLNNPFAKIALIETKPTKVREALTKEEHNSLIELCVNKGDERRIALAVISVTGARLSEATGLLVKDIHIKEKVIDIWENANRTLKTKNSRRSIPIVDLRIWKLLLKQIEGKDSEAAVFPSLTGSAKMNSVSATLVKFIKTKVNKQRDVHSIRHTIATRLKQVMAPDSIIEDILGWKKSSMIATYAGSMELETKRKWLKKALYDQKENHSER